MPRALDLRGVHSGRLTETQSREIVTMVVPMKTITLLSNLNFPGSTRLICLLCCRVSALGA